MKFNDTRLIKQAINTNIKELEPMYWVVEDSLREGYTLRAEGMLHSILYVAKYKPEALQGLQPQQRQRLGILVQEILGKKSIKKSEVITLKQPVNPRKIPFKLELELKSYLVEHSRILSEALEDSIKITGTEVETEEDYRCDIVAESSNKFYPIELKIAQGTHAVVSQCSKYCYYFYHKLRYDRFKVIQGVVIANGYDAWSINELRKEGHWIYIIPTSDTDITLERIH